MDVDCDVLGSVLPSNHKQIEQSVRMVEKTGRKKIGFLGLSFKPDTDDLRESPAVILAETLLGKGYNIKIFDKNVVVSRLRGKNKQFLLQRLPHINKLLVNSIEEFISSTELIVIISNRNEIMNFLIEKELSQIYILDGTISNQNLNNQNMYYEKFC